MYYKTTHLTKTDVIKKYLDLYLEDLKLGKTSKRKLAQIIYADKPLLFKDPSSILQLMRYIMGNNGKYSAKDKKYHFKSTEKHGIKYLTIPESRAEQKQDYILKNSKKLLVFSDVHIPYHSVEALETMFEFADKQDIDAILINGDLLDFYGISRWDKDPSKPKMREEIDMAKEFFTYLRDRYKCPIYYKLGNHEDRWEKFLISKAPELLGIDEFRLERILNLEFHSINLIASKQLIKYGKLNIIHGHEMGESIFSPVNPARGLFLKAKCSTLAGHNHQTSAHHENNVSGDAMACWSLGCLCDLSPEYRPFAFTKWNHGFAIVNILSENGDFSVNNYRILNGSVI